MNAPFDPNKAPQLQPVDDETIIRSLQDCQCYMESLSSMLFQATWSYEGEDIREDNDVRNRFKAFLSVCERLASLALEHMDNLNLTTSEALKIREKIYGLVVVIEEVSFLGTNISEITGVIYGLSYVSKQLQSDLSIILDPIEFKNKGKAA